jgi:hypothetical protein
VVSQNAKEECDRIRIERDRHQAQHETSDL